MGKSLAFGTWKLLLLRVRGWTKGWEDHLEVTRYLTIHYLLLHTARQIHFNTSTQNGELCWSRFISRHFLTKGTLLSCSIELTQTSDSWHNTPLPFADPLWVPWHPRGKATSRSRRKAVRIQEANQRKGKQIRKGRSLAASCTSIHPNPRIYYCIPSTLRNFGNQSRLLVALQRSACPRQPFCQLNS